MTILSLLRFSEKAVLFFILSQGQVLDKIPLLCYALTELNSIFRAGRNSPPAVKSASAQAQIRCNSGTDSTVWMEEDTQ